MSDVFSVEQIGSMESLNFPADITLAHIYHTFYIAYIIAKTSASSFLSCLIVTIGTLDSAIEFFQT